MRCPFGHAGENGIDRLERDRQDIERDQYDQGNVDYPAGPVRIEVLIENFGSSFA